MRKLISIALLACVVGTFAGTAATAAPSAGERTRGKDVRGHHKQPKIVLNYQAGKEAAANAVATGESKVRPDGVVRLYNGEFVEYELQGTDHIVVLLAQFTDPMKNQIEEPDPSTNNWRYWLPNFNRAHYKQMLFESGNYGPGISMRDYYLEQSSGRYTVDGQVSKWVSIPQPESEYGANSEEGGDGSDNLNGPVYRVVRAALQATAGVDEGINWSPSVVDVQDRYDCDGDGKFNEPDGYVDHFEVVHAGEGEEGGGGAQGGDAIWSHRWYAGQEGIGVRGPGACDLGGYKVPGTNLWVGDYTIQPEDGGVGVFAHEFGHDLGLPDLYDTAGGENGTSFWSLMSSSWNSDHLWTIGTNPSHMDVWSKMVLGFLGEDLAIMDTGDSGQVNLGPAAGATVGNAQALRVNLPNYIFTETVFEPEGEDAFYYYSGKGNDLDTAMTRDIEALTDDGELTARVQYDIETDWDYAYVIYTMDGWDTVLYAETNLSTDTNPNGQNFGNGITGSSEGWVDLTATIPSGANGIGFEYWTDGAVVGDGFAVDTISLNGEEPDTAVDSSAWDFFGFSVVENGEVSSEQFHYYLFENRQYLRNDYSLCGAYNWVVGEEWLEKQCYADGMLVWYRNSAFADNSTSEHEGFGMLLPVDSHPEALADPVGGEFWRTRWQTWDAPFDLDTQAVTLHELNGGGNWVGERYVADPVNKFQDLEEGAYWNGDIPQNSVITPGSGLKVRIAGQDGWVLDVRVSWAEAA